MDWFGIDSKLSGGFTTNLAGTIVGDIDQPVGAHITGDSGKPIGGRITGEKANPVASYITGNTKEPIGGRITGEIANPVASYITGNVKEPIGGRITGEIANPVASYITGNANEPIGSQITGDTKKPVAVQITGDPGQPVASTVELLNIPRLTLAEIKDIMTPEIRMHIPNYQQMSFKFLGVELFTWCMSGESEIITQPYTPNRFEECKIECPEEDMRPFPKNTPSHKKQ